jgi:hypothetical protein
VPKPERSVSIDQRNLIDILSEQEIAKQELRDFGSKRSLMDIQQEQEFQEWWDKETARVREEEEANAAKKDGSGRGKSGGRGGRRRGRGGANAGETAGATTEAATGTEKKKVGRRRGRGQGAGAETKRSVTAPAAVHAASSSGANDTTKN